MDNSLVGLRGYLITDIFLDEDNLVIILMLNNPNNAENRRLKIEARGRYCDDLWLDYSINHEKCKA